MPNCANMGFAAALLACLVSTCLMGEAHAYSCSTKSDCAYKGCADRPCSSTSAWCKNGVWDHVCEDTECGYYFNEKWAGVIWCPKPTCCAAGNYSTNGKDYLGLGACKPCDAGKYSAA